jgi:hypothetical protein
MAFNLRRFLHNLKVWEPPERPWKSGIITQDLRCIIKPLEADKAVAVNEDSHEEYLIDAGNRVLFDDKEHNWGLLQLYLEWSVIPAAIWQDKQAIKEVPPEYRTWWMSKNQNKWINGVPKNTEGKDIIELTSEEYYFQQIRIEAFYRGLLEAVTENKSMVAKFLVGTVIVTLCLVVLVGYFTQAIHNGTAVNPVAAVQDVYKGVSGGK